MATETTPEQATDEELIARAPAHDGVATQRDLRETERRLDDKIDTKFNRLAPRLTPMLTDLKPRLTG